MSTTQDKPRGGCTGCAFTYTLSTARSGEYKGLEVIRKHNSRKGPGLCEGAQKPPRLELGEATGDQQAFADPAPVTETDETRRGPWITASFDSECNGDCGGALTEGGEIRADGSGGWLCEDCGSDQTTDLVGAETVAEMRSVTRTVCGRELTARFEHNQWMIRFSPDHTWVGSSVDEVFLRIGTALQEEPERYGLPARSPATVAVADLPRKSGLRYTRPAPVATIKTSSVVTPEFASPAPVPEMTPVSGQPGPKRDRYKRYLLPGPDGRETAHTRATTFAKFGSSTYALSEWGERMLIKGLTMRPDLLAMAHGLDVKRDRSRLNQLADEAQAAGGNKVAANIGTALHGFSENLDAGLMTLDDVPEQWRGRMSEYRSAMAGAGLATRREWIERTTAVPASEVSAPLPVAGTLDRVLETAYGELIIGDLKSGSDLSYGTLEIEVQLWLYARGCNLNGLFDWNTGRWERLDRPVSEDHAVVMHLPADGTGCTLLRADLRRGRRNAQVSGLVQARQKDKSVMPVLSKLDLRPPEPPQRTDMGVARELIGAAPDHRRLTDIHRYAVVSGKFSDPDLAELKRLARVRWDELNG